MSLPAAAPTPPTPTPPAPAATARLLTPALLGWLAGITAQLQQAKLWPGASYVLLLGSALALLVAGLRAQANANPPGRPSSFSLTASFLALFAATLLGYASTGLRALGMQSEALSPALEQRDLTLTGRIAAMPQRTDNGTRFIFEVESAQLYEASKEQNPAQMLPIPARLHVPGQLALGWYGGWRDDNGALLEPFIPPPNLQAGERWRFNVRLRAVHGTRNPFGFDYELWMWEQDLHASGYVRTGRRDPPPQRMDAAPSTWYSAWLPTPYFVEQSRQQVRDAVLQRAPSMPLLTTPPRPATTSARTPLEFEPAGTRPNALPAPLGASAADLAEPDREQARALVLDRRNAFGVVAALVTGDQQAIARSDWDVFRATGVAHLMSISGLHITLFAWLAAAFIRLLWRWTPLLGPRLCLAWPAPHAGLLGGLLLATAYALFSGWGVPAQRTVLMLAVVTLLRLTGRRWPWPQLWLLTAAVVLATSPWALLQPGFWLSFVAVGILFASGKPDNGPDAVAQRSAPHGNDIETRPAWQRLMALPGSLGRPLWNLLREQSIVTLALAPLTLLFFGQVSLVGLIANLIAIPWVTLVVTPLALLGTLLPPHSLPLWDAAASAVQVLNTLLDSLALWPFATYSAPQAPLWVALAGITGGLLLVLRLPWSLRIAGLPLLLPALLWQPPRPVSGQFDLLAADVGQGQAVLVRTATHDLLYDAGPRYTNDSDAGERVLLPLLRAFGTRLDMVVLSHRDSDHTGGAAAVLGAHRQSALLSSLDATHELQAGRATGSTHRCEAGQSWEWDGVRFEVLHPRAEDYGLSAGRTPRSNTVSCVLRISSSGSGSGEASVGVRTALLTGDIERAQEQRLAAAFAAAPTPQAPVNLLLVPHHGSKTSSTEAFLDAVAPRIAIVQAGYRNRYGHPAPEVMARYAVRGIAVFDSPHCGAASWRSDQPGQIRCERVTAQRYWQHRF